MNKNDFERFVNDSAPDELKESKYLKLAIDHLFDTEGEIYKKTRNELRLNTILLASRFKLAANDGTSDPEKEIVTNSSHDILVSDYLVEQIEPWIKKIRLEVFKKEHPPFPENYNEAINWVISMEESDRARFITKERLEAFDEIERLAAEHQIKLTTVNDTLLLPTEDGHIKQILAIPSTTLSKLNRDIKLIAKGTGFNEPSVTMYLLTGIEPLLTRVKITSTKDVLHLTKSSLVRNSIAIEINTADLSHSELKSIYSNYRNVLNVYNKKPLTDVQVKFWFFIKNKGGPPTGKGATQKWRDIQKDWNKENPDDQLTSDKGNGAYMKYLRIKKKLDSQFNLKYALGGTEHGR